MVTANPDVEKFMADQIYQLISGNKNFSSWSLRVWLVMRKFNITFTELEIDFRHTNYKEQILEHIPSGKVPALKIGDLTIWDSLAICEYLAETTPDQDLWPTNPKARAIARSVSAEMHSSFYALRSEMPMDLVSIKPSVEISNTVSQNIHRIMNIWRFCRISYGKGGPFLFGQFSIADALYAPVASRLKTYDVDLSTFGDEKICKAYIDAIFALPEMCELIENISSGSTGNTPI